MLIEVNCVKLFRAYRHEYLTEKKSVGKFRTISELWVSFCLLLQHLFKKVKTPCSSSGCV